MFGDNEKTRELSTQLLEMFSLPELLEMNDLTEEDLVAYLLEVGFLNEPRTVIEGFEDDETED